MISKYHKNKWDKISWKWIYGVSFPLPPNPVNGLMYMPDCFASKSEDFKQNDPDVVIISARCTKHGISLLFRTRLSSLFFYSEENNILEIIKGSFCAAVSVKYFCEVSNLIYASDVVLDYVNFMNSCNPSSHFSFPNAPFTTALTQWYRGHERSQQNIYDYVDPFEAHEIYKIFDFSSNIQIDEALKDFQFNDGVRHSCLNAGLQSWSKVYLDKIRIQNIIVRSGIDVEAWAETKQRVENRILLQATQTNDPAKTART